MADVQDLARRMAEEWREALRAQVEAKEKEWKAKREQEARQMWERALELEPRLESLAGAVKFEPEPMVGGMPVLRIGDWPGIAVQVVGDRVFYWVARWDKEDGEEYWVLDEVWNRKGDLGEALALAEERARERAEGRGDEDEDEALVCPLMSAGQGAQYFCVEEQCAWWVATHEVGDGCALWVLSELLTLKTVK